MGFGDILMSMGDARRIHRGTSRKIAIGDGRKVVASDLFQGVPYLASQMDANRMNVLWVKSYPGNRPYIDYDKMAHDLAQQGTPVPANRKGMVGLLGAYRFKPTYRPTPAELVLTPQEQDLREAERRFGPWIAIEPHIKARAPVNKDWGFARYQAVADTLRKSGHRVVQMTPPGVTALRGVETLSPRSFREALVYLGAASLYVGPEGGLHHGAAAVGIPAVVVFGGYISPLTTGYDTHVNLTGGATHGCGTKTERCPHCTQALASITPVEVAGHAERLLTGEGPSG